MMDRPKLTQLINNLWEAGFFHLALSLKSIDREEDLELLERLFKRSYESL